MEIMTEVTENQVITKDSENAQKPLIMTHLEFMAARKTALIRTGFLSTRTFVLKHNLQTVFFFFFLFEQIRLT